MKYLFLMWLLVVSITASSQCLGYGYVVSVDLNGEGKITHTMDINIVDRVIFSHTGVKLDIDKLLKNSPYFDLRTEQYYLYCEIKVVYKVGDKYVYKKLTNKRKKEVETLKIRKSEFKE